MLDDKGNPFLLHYRMLVGTQQQCWSNKKYASSNKWHASGYNDLFQHDFTLRKNLVHVGKSCVQDVKQKAAYTCMSSLYL